MKKFFLIFIVSIFLGGCSSTRTILSVAIPDDKETIYLAFDNTQSTISTGGFFVGNVYFSGTESASFNTLDNRLLAKSILTEKGYKVTQKIENADMLLYGGCESNDVQSVVTLMLIDAKTEKEYIISKGTYGMGWDLNGDIKGALENALQNIPKK